MTTALLTGWQPQLMVRFASMPGDARSGRTLNSLHQGAEQSWLFLRLKLVVVGQLAFIRLLARAKEGPDPCHAQTCGTALAVEVAVALGALRSSAGAEGPTPLSQEVEGDFRGAGLAW